MTVGPVRTASSDGSRKLSRYWTGDRPSGEIANLAPQHFPDQAPFVPYSDAHNHAGKGSVGRPKETLFVCALRRAPMIASRGSWARFSSVMPECVMRISLSVTGKWSGTQ